MVLIKFLFFVDHLQEEKFDIVHHQETNHNYIALAFHSQLHLKNSKNALGACCSISLLYLMIDIFGLMLVKPGIFRHKLHMFTPPPPHLTHFSIFVFISCNLEAVTVPFSKVERSYTITLPFCYYLHLFNVSDWKLTLMFAKNSCTEWDINIMPSMLVISIEISLFEATSRTKPIFGFNNAIVKTLSGVEFSRAIAMSKKFNVFSLFLMSGL